MMLNGNNVSHRHVFNNAAEYHTEETTFGSILLFSNNNLLFYPLSSEKLSALASYFVLSYLRDTPINNSKLV